LRPANDSTRIESIATASTARDLVGMHLIRIDHVSLNVADRRASLAWYADVLGLGAGADHGRPDAPVFVGPDGAQLGVYADRAPGLRHVALATSAADQQRIAARLDRLGIAYTPERHSASESLYVPDLDGTMLEVMAPRR
jgi:catechol-2,3-dioxygenase